MRIADKNVMDQGMIIKIHYGKLGPYAVSTKDGKYHLLTRTSKGTFANVDGKRKYVFGGAWSSALNQQSEH